MVKKFIISFNSWYDKKRDVSFCKGMSLLNNTTAYINGNIITMADPKDTKQAIIIHGDTIRSVGSNEEILKYESNDIHIIDLKGKTIIPGFYDSHMHLMSTLFSLSAIDLTQVTCVADLLDLLLDHKKKHPHNQLFYGTGLSSFSLREKRFPTRKELDQVCPNHMVILSSIEFHTVIINSFAMHRLNIPFTTHSFEKDSQGVFTGKLTNIGSHMARKKMFAMIPEENYTDNMDWLMKKMIDKGVTTAVTMEGGALFHEKHVSILMEKQKNAPIDIEIFYSTTDISRAIEYNLPRIGGDIFLDGSFRSHNAALYESYEDCNSKGYLFFSKEELYEFISKAHLLSLQTAVHAVGPRAIDFLLDVYEEVLEKYPRKDHRHRIEHFELPTADQIERVKQLGLVLAMHPTYEYFFRGKGDMYEIRLGQSRSSKTNPFRSIVDAGIVVCGCSDSDVMPVDPLLGIHSAVNHPNKASRLTPYEALAMYTCNGAYAVFQDHIKGKILPGKKADFVITKENILHISPEKIKDVEILATVKSGKVLMNKLLGEPLC